jgi:Tol biopolymer transport system component
MNDAARHRDIILRMRRLVRAVPVTLAAAALAIACSAPAPDPSPTTAPAGDASLLLPGEERYLANVRQLTMSGENAEAYFAFDGTSFTYQHKGDVPCDQIYVMNVDGSGRRMVSTGAGRTTCAHFMPDGQSIVYASTHLGSRECPPEPGREQGYVWAIYDTFDIFRVDADGSNARRLTDTPGYDAEATVAKDGRIVFTSVRDGDMDIYSMNGDGSDVQRLTDFPGPDGGPFFSPDGSQIVFRGRHYEPGAERDNYFALLKQNLWRPTSVDVYVMNRDGSNLRQVTQGLGGANWAPFFTPDGKRIIFASNMKDPRGRNFDLYLINVDGTGLEQITFSEEFDGFPMFSPDGTKLIFSSNRNAATPGDTNVFIADWKR